MERKNEVALFGILDKSIQKKLTWVISLQAFTNMQCKNTKPNILVGNSKNYFLSDSDLAEGQSCQSSFFVSVLPHSFNYSLGVIFIVEKGSWSKHFSGTTRPITERLPSSACRLDFTKDSEYWIITKLAPFRRTLIQERQLFSISEGKMFTLNHNVLFLEQMFSSQFSIVGGNKINQLLFDWWVGGEGGVFSSSSELLLSVSFGWWT